MKRSDRIGKLNAINNGIKSMAGANLARAEAEYAHQLHQLEQLRIYKVGYSTQLRQRLAANVSPDEIQDYRYFFSSLYKAIKQQESIVSHMQRQVEESRREYVESDREVRKLNTVSDNLKKGEAVVEQRAEQKRSDEMSMLAMGRYAFGFKH